MQHLNMKLVRVRIHTMAPWSSCDGMHLGVHTGQGQSMDSGLIFGLGFELAISTEYCCEHVPIVNDIR